LRTFGGWFLLETGSESGRARFTDLVNPQVALADTEARPSGPPFSKMGGRKMAVECALIDPHFLYVDEARFEHVFGVTVFDASFFSATGISHPPHDWSSRFNVVGREANSSYDQQHDARV
jgi:hypothetical protein